MPIYEYLTHKEALAETLAKVDVTQDLAFDTETIGKYGKIRLAQFYQRHWDKAILVEWPDPYELAFGISKLGDCNLVIQYASYDVSTIQDQTSLRWMPNKFADTFLLARLGFPHLEAYSLDVLIEHCLDHDPYKTAGIDKDAMQKADWKQLVIPEQQRLYAAIDVYYLFHLYDKVKHCEETISYKLDISTLRNMLDFQRNGMPVDAERCQAKYIENQAELDRLAMPINVNSWQQVRPYINSNESDDLALAKLALFGNERAGDVRKARKLLKQNNFLTKFDTPGGRIYGKFAPSARSGRSTCNDQNLQQLPRSLKKMFGYQPDDGKVMLFSDYAQLELRTIAAITGEPMLCQLFKTGGDPHNYVAEMTFGANFTKDDRQVTKTENFNLLYGGGVPMLQSIILKQANMWIELDVLSTLVKKWKRLFPYIIAWQERGIKAYRSKQLGSTPFGRQYTGKLMTDQLNIENQGFGAEIAKLAMHYMMPKLKQYDAKLLNFIHDSYIVEVDNDPAIYEPCAQMIGQAMIEAWVEATKCVKVKDIPMPVKVLAGYNWGDIESGDFIYKYEA